MKSSHVTGPVSSNNVAETVRRAVGYVRVSTDMQAVDGLSLDAQTAAIEHYCTIHGLKLHAIYKDVISGAKDQRPGLQQALDSLQRGVDCLVVLKFDRLSRSIRHFCELYETYFKSNQKELIAIRESIRLDSSLGRALVSILLVFAQMEREATGERTREAINHIRRIGYHFGKIPYGHKTVQAPDNPRYRILVEDEAEQAVLSKIKALLDAGNGLTKTAQILTADGIAPPQGHRWTKSLIYNLKLRLGWHTAKPHNERDHTDEDVKKRMLELRNKGTTYKSIANILNEQGYKPLKGKKFTEVSVCLLIQGIKESKVLTPKAFCQSIIESNGGERPSLSNLAEKLVGAGFQTPKGNRHWWPAQVQQLLNGSFDSYYSSRRSSAASV